MVCSDVSIPRLGLGKTGNRSSVSSVLRRIMHTKGRQLFSKIQSHRFNRNNSNYKGFMAFGLHLFSEKSFTVYMDWFFPNFVQFANLHVHMCIK